MWPMDRRVLYNRASADPQGRPWSERKKLIWWDPDKGRVDRIRRSRLRGEQAAGLPAAAGRGGCGGAARGRPIHHQSDGKTGCSRPTACSTAPYHALQPHESPVRNALYPQQDSPVHLYGLPTTREPVTAGGERECSRSSSPPPS